MNPLACQVGRSVGVVGAGVNIRALVILVVKIGWQWVFMSLLQFCTGTLSDMFWYQNA